MDTPSESGNSDGMNSPSNTDETFHLTLEKEKDNTFGLSEKDSAPPQCPPNISVGNSFSDTVSTGKNIEHRPVLFFCHAIADLLISSPESGEISAANQTKNEDAKPGEQVHPDPGIKGRTVFPSPPSLVDLLVSGQEPGEMSAENQTENKNTKPGEPIHPGQDIKGRTVFPSPLSLVDILLSGRESGEMSAENQTGTTNGLNPEIQETTVTSPLEKGQNFLFRSETGITGRAGEIIGDPVSSASPHMRVSHNDLSQSVLFSAGEHRGFSAHQEALTNEMVSAGESGHRPSIITETTALRTGDNIFQHLIDLPKNGPGSNGSMVNQRIVSGNGQSENTETGKLNTYVYPTVEDKRVILPKITGYVGTEAIKSNTADYLSLKTGDGIQIDSGPVDMNYGKDAPISANRATVTENGNNRNTNTQPLNSFLNGPTPDDKITLTETSPHKSDAEQNFSSLKDDAKSLFKNLTTSEHTKIPTDEPGWEFSDQNRTKQVELHNAETGTYSSRHAESTSFSHLSRPAQPADHISRIENIRELGEVMARAAGVRQKRAVLNLNPPELGKVRIELSLMRNNELHAVFRADHADVKPIIEGNIHQLRTHLDQKGFSLTQYSVDVGGDQNFTSRQGDSHESPERSLYSAESGNSQEEQGSMSSKNKAANHPGKISLTV